MLAFANMMNFFAHEFAGLSGWRLAFTSIFPCSINRSLLGHDDLYSRICVLNGWLVSSFYAMGSIANRNFTLGVRGILGRKNSLKFFT